MDIANKGAKLKKMITLTQEALDELEALSANDTHKYNESSVIEALIHEAYARAAQPQPQKRIEPFKSAKGKLIGWHAYYGDHRVGTFDLNDKVGAQLALDRFVYEELSK